jgi:hypothetical protein
VYELYVLGPERVERLHYVNALVKAVEHKLPGDSQGPERPAEPKVALQW